MLAKFVALVFLLLLIFVLGLGSLIRAFFGILPKPRSGRSDRIPRGSNPRRQPPGRAPDKAERVLACTVCGVHVPESEGISADGKFFCCKAHRAGYGAR